MQGPTLFPNWWSAAEVTLLTSYMTHNRQPGHDEEDDHNDYQHNDEENDDDHHRGLKYLYYWRLPHSAVTKHNDPKEKRSSSWSNLVHDQTHQQHHPNPIIPYSYQDNTSHDHDQDFDQIDISKFRCQGSLSLAMFLFFIFWNHN